MDTFPDQPFASTSTGRVPPTPGLFSPTFAMSPKSRTQRKGSYGRAASETSEDSPVSREASPPATGPWREKRRPSVSSVYDLPSALERSVALTRSRSSSSASSRRLASHKSAGSPRLPGRSTTMTPLLAYQPASPEQPPVAVFPVSPLAPNPGSFGATATKRQRNKKLLSLNIAAATSQPGASLGGARSCPPSPMLQQEGSSKDLKALRANVRGDMSMRKRPSLPHLSGTADDGHPVRLIGRNGEDGRDESDAESFPYENGPREILPGIFLGSEQNAKDAACLQKMGISFVLNVAKEVKCPWEAEATIEEEEAEELIISLPSAHSPASSSGTSSPVLSDPSLSPSSMATTVSYTSQDVTVKLPPPVVETQRPQFIRTTASTPNLFASMSAARAERRPSDPSLLGTRRFPPNAVTGRPALEYLHLPWSHDEDNLIRRFRTAFAFVDRARAAGGKVLIHCQCGVSRSATAMIAFVMREAAAGQTVELKGVTGMHEAYQWVKDRSGWITPNMGLLYQLREYEQSLTTALPAADASTTPSTLTPAMLHLDMPFGADESTSTSNDDAMDTDPPAAPPAAFGIRTLAQSRAAHRRTFSTDRC